MVSQRYQVKSVIVTLSRKVVFIGVIKKLKILR